MGSLGWIYRGQMEDGEDEFAGLESPGTPGYSALPSAIAADRRNALIFGGLGAGVLTVGWGFLMPRRSGVPWWTWIVGAAGAGLAAWGVIETLKDGTCVGPLDSTGQCVVETSPWVRGPLILGYALPLLLTPIVYAIRNDPSPSATRSSLWIAPEVGPGRLGLRAAASF